MLIFLQVSMQQSSILQKEAGINILRLLHDCGLGFWDGRATFESRVAATVKVIDGHRSSSRS